MNSAKRILKVLENMTLAELKDELELVVLYENRYPKFFKPLLLAELDRRLGNKKEVEE